jgi:peptide/nickel transport system substrate-binding protein
MNLPKFCFVFPALFLLASCGNSPEGKFKDDKTSGNNSLDTSKRFVHNAKPSKFEDDWSKENVVVYHWRSEPDNLHPTNGKSNPRQVILFYTQRFLVSVDLEKLELRPDLVKALPTVSADGLTYTYELRDEPTWDDGSQLTVDDVIFSIMAEKCPYTDNAFVKPYFDILENITVDASNPRKFYMHMKSKYIQNVAFDGDMPIMERKYYDPQNVLGKYTMEQFSDPEFAKTQHKDLIDWAKEFNDAKYGHDLDHLNGLGAYKVTKWDSKQQLELTKKTNHWTSKIKDPSPYDTPIPDKIIFRITQDDNAIALEFKKQTYDVSNWISTHGLGELQKDPDFNRNYHSAFVPNFNYQYIGFNMKPEAVNRLPFFVDKRVRKAIAFLVPVDDIIKSYYEGKATRMVSVVTPTKGNLINKDLAPIPFNVDSAKKLLDEAGWKDSDGDNIRDKMIDGKKVQFEFDMMIISGSTVTDNMAKDIQADMYKAGIKANIHGVEFVSFYDQLQHHDFDLYFGAWAGSFVPDDYKQIWSTASYTDGSNFVGFGTPQSDALIDSIRVETNDSIRTPMDKRFQKVVYDEQPYVFLFTVSNKIAIHKRFDHADMYFEKPCIFMSFLECWAPGNVSTTANTP